MAQTYGIRLAEYDLDGEPPDKDVRWLSSLCAQLPAAARVRVMDDPDLAWDDATRMQRAIDYRLQEISYLLQGSKGSKPKALDTPSEVSRKAQIAEDLDKNRAMVDELLGIVPFGGDA